MGNDGTSALAIIEQPRLTLIPAETTSNSAFALATMAAKSGLCKTRQPADAFFVIMYGYELGIPAMTALRTIHIINQTPVCSGEAMLALIRRSGKAEIKITGDDNQAVVYMKRKDTGEEYTATWTLERGTKAGLTTKQGSNWGKFPQAMMKWRGVSECAKFLFSDVIGGLYTFEEIAPDTAVNEDGSMIGEIIVSKPEPTEPEAWYTEETLCRLADRCFENKFIGQGNCDGIPAMEALIAPKTWADFENVTAAALAVKAAFEALQQMAQPAPAIDPIVQQVAATITTEQAAESLAHKPGRISTDAPNWETDRSKLLALAAEACEKGWITSDGETGIGEMEAMLKHQTWANFPTQFQAKQAIRAIYAEQEAQTKLDAHKPGNSSFARGLDTYEAQQAQKDIDDANAEIDATMQQAMERDV